jgi:hypothetical protein
MDLMEVCSAVAVAICIRLCLRVPIMRIIRYVHAAVITFGSVFPTVCHLFSDQSKPFPYQNFSFLSFLELHVHATLLMKVEM